MMARNQGISTPDIDQQHGKGLKSFRNVSFKSWNLDSHLIKKENMSDLCQWAEYWVSLYCCLKPISISFNFPSTRDVCLWIKHAVFDLDYQCCHMSFVEFCQDWFWLWIITWCHKAITWTNNDFSLAKPCGICSMAILRQILKASIAKICLMITSPRKINRKKNRVWYAAVRNC